MVQQFEFPLHMDVFMQIEGKEELRGLLRKQSATLKLGNQYFRVCQQSQTYIYARCFKCKAILKYKKSENTYILHPSFSNHHRHAISNLSSQIQTFINDIPANFPTSSAMKITTKAFNIKASKFYYHYQKLWSQTSTFKSLLDELQYKNHQTRLIPFPLPEGQIPDIFIDASPTMIQNFKNFGQNQFVTFDITYGLVKESKLVRSAQTGLMTNRKWGLGLFLGINCNNKPIPFAYCLTNSQTKEDFMGIFKSFFEMMKGQPQAIITDQQASIDAAIKNLKEDGDYRGTHLLDSFHILRNVSKKTRNYNLLRNFRDAMMAKTDEEYKKVLLRARQSIENDQDMKVYDRFVLGCQKYCYSQIPVTFCGVSISTSFGQKVNDYVKTLIQYEKPFKSVIKKVKIKQSRCPRFWKDFSKEA